MLRFYQELYETGRVMLRSSLMVNSKELKEFLEKVVRDGLINMPILEIPDLSKSWNDSLLNLGRVGYGLCYLALSWDDGKASKLQEAIKQYPIVKDRNLLILAHGFLGGLSPLQEKLPEKGKVLWDLLVSKSPLTQVIEVDSRRYFPEEWDWEFLWILWKQEIFHALVKEKIVGMKYAAMRKSLGKRFQEWIQEKEKKRLVWAIYGAYDRWKDYYPWDPTLQEMRKDIEAGRLYIEEGWYDFFGALSERYRIECADFHAESDLRYLSGDFLGLIEDLKQKAEKWRKVHPGWEESGR